MIEAAEKIVSRRTWAYLVALAYFGFLAGWYLGHATASRSVKDRMVRALEKV